VEETPTLIEAAQLWKEGKVEANTGAEKQEKAKDAFLKHAKENKLEKYKTCGLSVSYGGQHSRRYLDEKMLKTLISDKLIEQCMKEGKKWEDIRIR
jgi:hypothetical protein